MPYESDLEQFYQEGSVTSFTGATGMLEELLSLVVGTEVIAAALSGSGSGPYTATLSTPVGLGRIVLTYDFASTEYTAYDNGAGLVEGTNISSGTINYETGAISITFTAAPDAAPEVDYLYGNPGQDWRLLVYRNTKNNGSDLGTQTEPFGSACKEVVLQNTGHSGQENILVGIREWRYLTDSAYGWNLNIYKQWLTGGVWNQSKVDHGIDTYGTTYNNFQYHPTIYMTDTAMNYWIYSNRARIQGVVQVQSDYFHFYLGLGLRYADESKYPYPCLCKGSSMGDHNSTSTLNKGIVDYRSNFWFITPNGGFNRANAHSIYFWPWYGIDPADGTINRSERVMPAFPISIVDTGTHYMDMEGARQFCSQNLLSQDIIEHGDGKRYKIFQNGKDTAWYDFGGIAYETFTTTTTTSTTTTTTTATT